MATGSSKPEKSFRQAHLTPDEARQLVGKAGYLAVEDMGNLSPDARPYVIKHFRQFFDVIDERELTMKPRITVGAATPSEVGKLSMDALQTQVQHDIQTLAYQKALELFEEDEYLLPTPSESPLEGGFPTQSNEKAARAVQNYLEAAYQQPTA